MKSADELSTSEARQLIRDIKKAGFQIMIFSGGEPLMRPDIYELGAYATEQGLRAVMGTNGSLITPEVARKLKEAGFMAAGVSLDSLDPDKNNAFRKLDQGLPADCGRNEKSAGSRIAFPNPYYGHGLECSENWKLSPTLRWR